MATLKLPKKNWKPFTAKNNCKISNSSDKKDINLYIDMKKINVR